jgi:hypothetical protein
LIKVINLISLIIAPIIVAQTDIGIIGWILLLICLGAMIWALMRSKAPAQYAIDAMDKK